MMFVLELLDSPTSDKIVKTSEGFGWIMLHLDDILSDCFSRISLKLDADLCMASIGSGTAYCISL